MNRSELRDFLLRGVENLARLLMEWAIRKQEVYLRSLDQIVEETWTGRPLRRSK